MAQALDDGQEGSLRKTSWKIHQICLTKLYGGGGSITLYMLGINKETRKDEVMKNSMKKLLALFVCVCMLMSGTAYAQESSIDGQETSALKVQGTETNAEEQKQGEAVNPEGQTQKEELKKQEEQKDEAKAGEKKAKAAKQADARIGGDVAINEANFPDVNFRDYVNDFDTDGDGNLSASEISAVTEISILIGGISDLTGIGYFTSLTRLNCRGNELTSLDVSKNVNLTDLDCSDNKLGVLDVSKNVNLENLDCGNNKLTGLDISKNVNLENLYCGKTSVMENGNQLTSLDVSQNTNLVALNCDSNELTSLEVSKNANLEHLECSDNKLTSLDVSKNVNLENLYCEDNKLTSLVVSKNTNLVGIFCGGNGLTSLDVSENANLENLYCEDNKLTSLDVSKNANLVNLACGCKDITKFPGNELTSLDVSKNANLEYLDCSGNKLTSLDISKNVNLYLIWCYSNELTSLDVSKNVNLIDLVCGGNKLGALDVSKNVKLENLNCGNNKLTGLDVSKNTILERLICNDNQLTSLDVRNCTELTYLDVRPLPKTAVQYTKEPDEFYYGESAAVAVSTKINASEIKAQTSGINTRAICKAFNIDENADVEVVVEQKDASPANQRRVMDYAGKYGDRVIKVYEIVMNLYEDGEHKATVTDNFGRLTLSLYAGKEHAGKTVTVYQLHGTSEVIPYRDLTVDENGMVTITVSKLSTFAVALQNTDGGASPKTGDTANMAVWIVLAVLAMSAIPIIARRKQKR